MIKIPSSAYSPNSLIPISIINESVSHAVLNKGFSTTQLTLNTKNN